MSTYDYLVLRAKIERISQEGRTGFSECLLQVKLNDLHHNLWRAQDALDTLDTGTRERKELLEEILRIAEVHDRAERYIKSSMGRQGGKRA